MAHLPGNQNETAMGTWGVTNIFCARFLSIRGSKVDLRCAGSTLRSCLLSCCVNLVTLRSHYVSLSGSQNHREPALFIGLNWSHLATYLGGHGRRSSTDCEDSLKLWKGGLNSACQLLHASCVVYSIKAKFEGFSPLQIHPFLKSV
jgi:hypothetical protein